MTPERKEEIRNGFPYRSRRDLAKIAHELLAALNEAEAERLRERMLHTATRAKRNLLAELLVSAEKEVEELKRALRALDRKAGE